MSRSRVYTVFGLVLRSDFELEFLEEVGPAAEEIDVHVLRSSHVIREGPYPYDPYFGIQPDSQYMHWSFVGGFFIPDPSQVLIEPYDGVSDHMVSQALLGLVMSLVLERRQVLCLHASAVTVEGRAAVFMGDKGAGKSTTSGALLARGYSPITDDLVPVTAAEDAPIVAPGFSSIKLFPDSVAALALADAEGDRRIHPQSDKMQKPMPVPVPRQTVPMGAVFVLKRAPDVDSPYVEALPPHEALQMVMRYTFMARYGETRLGPVHLMHHMKRCGGVVAHAKVYNLWIPDDLGQLDALADVIVAATAG